MGYLVYGHLGVKKRSKTACNFKHLKWIRKSMTNFYINLFVKIINEHFQNQRASMGLNTQIVIFFKIIYSTKTNMRNSFFSPFRSAMLQIPRLGIWLKIFFLLIDGLGAVCFTSSTEWLKPTLLPINVGYNQWLKKLKQNRA